MKTAVSLFPTLDNLEAGFASVNPSVSYSFQYSHDNILSDIKSSIERNGILLDSDSNYYRDFHDLYMTVHVSIQDITKLFGPSSIAPSGATLSVMVEVFSQKSRFRSVALTKKEIQISNAPLFDEEFSIVIPKRSVSSSCTINVMLYLKKKAGTIREGEEFLNNDEGVLLGSLDSKELYLLGDGSLFPVIDMPLGSEEPLWEIKIQYDDPNIDRLYDSIQVILNTNHKDYKYVNLKDTPNLCEPFVFEIVAEAMTLLFEDLKNSNALHWNDEAEPGSIMDEMKYLKNVLNIDCSESREFNQSLRKYLGKGE